MDNEDSYWFVVKKLPAHRPHHSTANDRRHRGCYLKNPLEKFFRKIFTLRAQRYKDHKEAERLK